MAFSGICLNTCDIEALVANGTNCGIPYRRKTPSRLLFFDCSLEIPDPMADNIKPLFDSGEIVYTSELTEWDFPEPTYEEFAISACRPVERILSTRQISFQDRVRVSILEGSPAEEVDYHDYTFWKDKLEASGRFNVGIVYCDGDVVFPRTDSGQLLSVSLSGYITYIPPSQQGGAWLEVKNFTLEFQGDPFGFRKPDFNLTTEGIVL